jgi:hypothetical protein
VASSLVFLLFLIAFVLVAHDLFPLALIFIFVVHISEILIFVRASHVAIFAIILVPRTIERWQRGIRHSVQPMQCARILTLQLIATSILSTFKT